MTLPEATVTICNDCPWRRESLNGWLGPFTAEQWIALAHSDEPIACHQTIEEEDSWEGAFQCAGAAQYRKNIAKLPKNPEVAIAANVDRETVFSRPAEFTAHHTNVRLA